jgi:hypothetical protein
MSFGEIFRVLKRFENFEIQNLGHNELAMHFTNVET